MFDNFFIRNIEYQSLFERFFVSAVGSILFVRFFLHVFHYPQIGGFGFHIAHILWGGLFMAISILLFMFFINSELMKLSAVLGGIGFGLFIDELGKFVTASNNYFFQPSIAIMYVAFVVLYVVSSAIGRKVFTKREYLINSIELLKDVVNRDLSREEKEKVLEYISFSDQRLSVVAKMREVFKEAETTPKQKLNIFVKWGIAIRDWYITLMKKSWFTTAISTFFIVQAVIGFLSVLILAAGITVPQIFQFIPGIFGTQTHRFFYNLIPFVSSGLAFLLVLLGVGIMRKSRIEAYIYFRWSVMISLFITQVFSFYRFQWGGLFGFIFYMLVLSVLNYMIDKQRSLLVTS